METAMSELHGVRSAARLLNVTPTSVYISTAKGQLRAKVDPTDGQMLWDEDELVLFRKRLDAVRDAKLQASTAERDAKFRAVNRRGSA
jgi:hypothetical protein